VNALSHRDEHRETVLALRQAVDGRPTGEQYRTARRMVARRRRAEQQRARIAAGTDRAKLRAKAAF